LLFPLLLLFFFLGLRLCLRLRALDQPEAIGHDGTHCRAEGNCEEGCKTAPTTDCHAR